VSGTVLVTGGAGYIGSHVLLALQARDRRVVVLDDLSTGSPEAVAGLDFVEGDVSDEALVAEVLRTRAVTSVIHFAASIMPPASISDPGAYYSNNTSASLTLARASIAAGVRAFVFSSSAAVYGDPERAPVRETDATRPISPYGWSKLMTEIMLTDLSRAHPGFKPMSLRYFNVGGADPRGRTGQRGGPSTHLIRAAVEAALGRREQLEIYGVDYGTRDGTCERDYIHVTDLADVHVAALEHLEGDGEPDVLNCGYGRGYTVKEVIATLETIVGRRVPVTIGERRAGDAARFVADVERLRRRLGWRPRYDSLEAILRTTLEWEKARGREAGSQARA
jgi:UDP-glucose 4-epimerase